MGRGLGGSAPPKQTKLHDFSTTLGIPWDDRMLTLLLVRVIKLHYGTSPSLKHQSGNRSLPPRVEAACET